jgi:hypothetical protein
MRGARIGVVVGDGGLGQSDLVPLEDKGVKYAAATVKGEREEKMVK